MGKILVRAMSSTISSFDTNLLPGVVLGATGRLGQILRAVWQDAPVKWQSRTASAEFDQVDILNEPAKLQGLLNGAAWVICLAGVTDASGGDLKLNRALAVAALDAACKAGAGPVLLASSAAVYAPGGRNLKENRPCNPSGAYGQAKLEMERAANAHPHPSTNLRIGNIAGADAILGGWQPGMQIDSFADGATPRRSYMGPITLARVMATLAGRSDLPQVLNLAAPGAIEMGTLLDATGRAWSPRPATDATIAEVVLNTDMLEQVITFAPQASTATGMVDEWRAIEALT